MNPRILLAVLAAVWPASLPGEVPWHSQRLTSEFFAEGAGVGDIDGDGNVDLTYGPMLWRGPGFEESQRFADGEPFIAEQGYSDNFFSFVFDANGDARNDILVFGFPGKDARLYLNPGETDSEQRWEMFLIAPEISNESPHFIDIVPGGLPEIVCTKAGAYGYYEATADATQPWQWRAVSKTGEAGNRFEHGLGVGDVNGDGRLDLVQRMFWYENVEGDGLWKRHRWSLKALSGGAQILVEDVDGDGDADLITSLVAHGHGLAWFEQYSPGKFQPHKIMGASSTDNPFGVCFSQLHALELADIDGDGRTDFVTGKRYLAHQGKDVGGLEAPVLYWFRNTAVEEGIEFVPHFVDDDSGVGVELKVSDLNGDNLPDIISSNKKGLAIHLQNPNADILGLRPERWKVKDARPQDTYGSDLTAAESVEAMGVPPGFEVDLIAAEPELTQPIAMTFDASGRIWVIEGHNYPERSPGDYSAGKDRVIIFEDTTGDGNFDLKKTFLEGVNLASGIEVGFGGVYIGAPPYLLFYADENQDDVPDGEPEILLDGWGYQDTHETLNAFTWGPDGWLYGCQGVFTHSKVGRPGTPDAQRVRMNAGVWRFHPVSKELQVFSHGTSNPWGVDFNDYGDWFISACVIPHFYHLTKGGLYQRQAGQHFNPWAFGNIQTVADHAHYAGNIRD
ncbi:MAG: PVC-type heme-binding CxxCH protein, partial [Verrucomicrobiota bacterium]